MAEKYSFLASKLSDNANNYTVGILTIMSWINSMLNWVEHEHVLQPRGQVKWTSRLYQRLVLIFFSFYIAVQTSFVTVTAGEEIRAFFVYFLCLMWAGLEMTGTELWVIDKQCRAI